MDGITVEVTVASSDVMRLMIERVARMAQNLGPFLNGGGVSFVVVSSRGLVGGSYFEVGCRFEGGGFVCVIVCGGESREVSRVLMEKGASATDLGKIRLCVVVDLFFLESMLSLLSCARNCFYSRQIKHVFWVMSAEGLLDTERRRLLNGRLTRCAADFGW